MNETNFSTFLFRIIFYFFIFLSSRLYTYIFLFVIQFDDWQCDTATNLFGCKYLWNWITIAVVILAIAIWITMCTHALFVAKLSTVGSSTDGHCKKKNIHKYNLLINRFNDISHKKDFELFYRFLALPQIMRRK